MDYSEDPSPDKTIFVIPSFASSSRFAPSSSTVPVPPQQSLSVPPEVYLTFPSSAGSYPTETSPFEVPPLSPSDLQFLASHTLPSPSFDPQGPPLFSEPLPPPPIPPASRPSAPGARQSGCFETPAVANRPADPPSREGITNPLVDHPSAPHTGKKKTKCVRSTARDIAIKFDESRPLGEFMDIAKTMLVGHVRGRTYTAQRLK